MRGSFVNRPGSGSSGRELKAFRGSREDLRALKRALANAKLGPKATMALTAAVIALEHDLETDEPVLR